MYKRTLALLVAILTLEVKCNTASTETSTDGGSTSMYSVRGTIPTISETSAVTESAVEASGVVPRDSSSGQIDEESALYGRGVPCTRNDRKGLCVRYKDCMIQTQTNDGIDINGSGITEPRNCPDEPVFVENREGCGWRNPQGIGYKRVEDDSKTQFGEFPWMVGILSVENAGTEEVVKKLNIYLGGGSLIHPSIVLTAAHVVAKHDNVMARAGEWDTQNLGETYPHQSRNVTSREINKDFDKNKLYYDVALLFLEKPFDLAPNVGLACLPPALEKAQGGTKCFASGWGKDKFGKEGRYQVILKKVELPVVEHEVCQQQLRTTRLSYRFILHSSFMCAGGEQGKDTCTGDGGSPLVCSTKVQDRYVQYGMVAWGIGCLSGTPSVYVDLPVHRAWIDETVKRRGYETTTYSNY